MHDDNTMPAACENWSANIRVVYDLHASKFAPRRRRQSIKTNLKEEEEKTAFTRLEMFCAQRAKKA